MVFRGGFFDGGCYNRPSPYLLFDVCKCMYVPTLVENSYFLQYIHSIICKLTSLFRYSSKVDLYVPKISACLKDESVLVRKQTLTLLTHLLQVQNCLCACVRVHVHICH